ncbi:MAG: S1 RNA-binding domain-containing protein [Clostridia bacterium]|nr:S1 RNA-binding domain-containing protein [Clostridia bacterium]MBR2327611.1 S1 RNA-binding domain-containing protein [Clostridia bacterium]
MVLEIGQIQEGKVTGITKFGVFVALDSTTTGMVHISEVSKDYVKDLNDYVKVGDTVRVKVIGNEKGKISLSMSKAIPEVKKTESFEDMLLKFKQRSDDKMSDLKRSTDSKRGGGRSRGSKKF